MASAKQCCVPDCKNTRDKKIPMHCFPNPDKEPSKFRQWIYNIGGDIFALDNLYIFKCRRVCHVHFDSKYHTWSNRLSIDAIPTLHLKGAKAIAHYFPNHEKDPERFKIWVTLSGKNLSNIMKCKRNVVCHRHFTEKDLVRNNRLNNLAVPSLYLSGYPGRKYSDAQNGKDRPSVCLNFESGDKHNDKSETIDDNTEPIKKRFKEIETDCLGPIESTSEIDIEKVPKNREVKRKVQEGEVNVKCIFTAHNFRVLKHDNALYKQKINELLENELKLKLQIKKLEEKVDRAKREFVLRAREVFADVLSANEIDVIMSRKLQPRWTNDEYAKACVLLNISREAYRCVKETFKFPLPSILSTQTWGKLNSEIIKDKSNLHKRKRLKIDKVNSENNDSETGINRIVEDKPEFVKDFADVSKRKVDKKVKACDVEKEKPKNVIAEFYIDDHIDYQDGPQIDVMDDNDENDKYFDKFDKHVNDIYDQVAIDEIDDCYAIVVGDPFKEQDAMVAVIK